LDRFQGESPEIHMKPIFKLFIISCLSVYCQITYAQVGFQAEDLRADEPFFQQQLQQYQKWLDFSGFGQILKTQTLDVDSQKVYFYLTFRLSHPDSLIKAWQQLKNDFEAENNLTFEEHLFYRMTHLTETQANQAVLEIYDTYALDQKTHFSLSISGNTQGVKTEFYTLPQPITRGLEESTNQAQLNSPPSWSLLRSVVRPVEVAHADLSKCKRLSTTQVRDFLSKRNVYKQVLDYAEAKYKVKGAKLLIVENGKNLRFEVINLRREVLTDKANPILARVLKYFGYDVNWVRRELLIFTIGFRETPAGIVLQCEIQGKYGSGFYENVKRGGYIEMEPEFTNYLEHYADDFAQEVYVHLTR